MMSHYREAEIQAWIDLYRQDTMTMRDVAMIYSVPQSTVSAAFIKRGVVAKTERMKITVKKLRPVYEQAKRLYFSGMAPKAIGLQLGINRKTIYNWINRSDWNPPVPLGAGNIWCACGANFITIDEYKLHKKEAHQ